MRVASRQQQSGYSFLWGVSNMVLLLCGISRVAMVRSLSSTAIRRSHNSRASSTSLLNRQRINGRWSSALVGHGDNLQCTTRSNQHPLKTSAGWGGMMRQGKNGGCLFSSSSSDGTSGEGVLGPASEFFASSDGDFASLGIKSKVLLDRLEALALTRPSAVQAASFDKIASGNDTIVGGETGSGKTLAYLLPLLDNILISKQEGVEYDYAKAIILVPNKELVNQVVRMACDLCGGRANSLVWGTSGGGVDFRDSLEVAAKGDTETNDVDPKDIVRIGVMPGGLGTPNDYKPFRSAIGLGGSDAPIDLVITTPASLGPLALSPKNIDMFADVETLVIDEADMLLDGGYIRQLDNVLMGFRRADRLDDSYGVRKTQHVFVAATLPDMGLKSVDAYMNRRFPHAERITMAGMHNARHYGLREQTKWIADTGMGNKGRLELVVEMLTNPDHSDSLIGEKVMIFLNSVQDVDGATNALRRAGIKAVPYHAKIPLAERSENLDKYRRYVVGKSDTEEDWEETVPVLVCTDLASRGLDVPGVTAVVQLQFAGNVVAHLHRMGRCGRAGKRDGRGVIFYDTTEAELVSIVQEAESRQDRMVLEGDVDEPESSGDGKGGAGSVKDAFSRKRGFTKKRKKERRELRESNDAQE